MAEKKKVKKESGFDHFFFVRLVEKIVGGMRKLLTPKLLDFCTRWLRTLGHYSILIASCLSLLIGIIGAIRLKNFNFFLYALAFSIGIFIIQYTAKRFSHAGEILIENNPSSMSSSAFLDSLGLLAMISGIIIFLYNVYLAIDIPSFTPLLYGLAYFLFLEFVALVAFHPHTATLKVVDNTSAGEEAIGIITFFIKKLMRLVPIVFGIGLIVYTILLFVNGFISPGLFSDIKKGFAAQAVFMRFGNIISFALLPFLSYIFFVFAYLVVDLIRAILSIPEKMGKAK